MKLVKIIRTCLFRYKKLEVYIYKPNILVADGGDQITKGFQEAFGYSSIDQFTRVMCWAHVHRNCQDYANKFIKEDKARGEVLNDIDLLQAMPSPEAFDHACKLFFEKSNESKI